jgi:hypothetical protein
MTRYLISFDDGAMDHIPDEDWAAEEALAWAAKTAVACRCAVEVRELMPDPEQDAMLRQADRRR